MTYSQRKKYEKEIREVLLKLKPIVLTIVKTVVIIAMSLFVFEEAKRGEFFGAAVMFCCLTYLIYDTSFSLRFFAEDEEDEEEWD